MGEKLGVGDVFLLLDGMHVMVNKYNTEVGKVYKRGKSHEKTRWDLKGLVADFLTKRGVQFDYDVVIRFANYIAKDVPESTFVFPFGHFVVFRIDSHDGANHETVHCKRFPYEPGKEPDQMSFIQNSHGVGPYPHHVLFTVGPGEY